MTIESILSRLRTELQTMYGSRLKGLYMYGSDARGRQDIESDVDVLTVLDRGFWRTFAKTRCPCEP